MSYEDTDSIGTRNPAYLRQHDAKKGWRNVEDFVLYRPQIQKSMGSSLEDPSEKDHKKFTMRRYERPHEKPE